MSASQKQASDPAVVKIIQVDSLAARVYASPGELAEAAGRIARQHLREVISRQGTAAVILATGNSQIQFLQGLAATDAVDWSRVTFFHMDEYLGIDPNHPASFRRYLRERVEVRLHPKQFHYLDGDTLLPIAECDRYARLLLAQPIDLCCLGIGENGHIAFNDPSVADFDDSHHVKLVKLEESCRQQQVGEGHFPNLQLVPQYAFTLTIPMLCSASRMLCIV